MSGSYSTGGERVFKHYSTSLRVQRRHDGVSHRQQKRKRMAWLRKLRDEQAKGI